MPYIFEGADHVASIIDQLETIPEPLRTNYFFVDGLPTISDVPEDHYPCYCADAATQQLWIEYLPLTPEQLEALQQLEQANASAT